MRSPRIAREFALDIANFFLNNLEELDSYKLIINGGKKTKDTREKNIFSVEAELTTADGQIYKSRRDCHQNRATCSVLLKLPKVSLTKIVKV